jgi:hypothetical protein
MKNGKVKETLQSRKFWLTIGTMIMAVCLFLFGEIDIDKLVEIIRWAAGLYVGGLSIEDGFKKLGPAIKAILKE